MALEVGPRALRKAYASHRDSTERLLSSASSYLLLFYSIECGRKAALMSRRALRSTSQLDVRERSHDIRHLAEGLRLSARLLVKLRECQLRLNGGPVPLADLHQAWRYGAILEPGDEAEAVTGLEELGEWCRNELRI